VSAHSQKQIHTNKRFSCYLVFFGKRAGLDELSSAGKFFINEKLCCKEKCELRGMNHSGVKRRYSEKLYESIESNQGLVGMDVL
jgi:hypothetical protein